MPQHFQQSYDLGTLVAAWVTKLQQAWHLLQLRFTLGEALLDMISILDAADKYDKNRADLENDTIPPSAFTWRSAGNWTVAL